MPAVATPVAATERVSWIDALRGFALLGIIIANLESSMLRFLLPGNGHDLGPLASLNVPFEFFESALIQGKFYSIFSFLLRPRLLDPDDARGGTGRRVRRLLPPPAGGAAAHRRRARVHLARRHPDALRALRVRASPLPHTQRSHHPVVGLLDFWWRPSPSTRSLRSSTGTPRRTRGRCRSIWRRSPAA